MNHIKPNTMKTIVKIILAGMAVLVTPGFISAQTINWGSLGKEDKHVLNLNAGWDYGVAFGTGYGYHFDIRSLNMPLVLDIGFNDQDQKGFLIEGFEFEPSTQTVVNFSYLPALVQQSGYSREMDYVVYHIDLARPVPDVYRRIVGRLYARNTFELPDFTRKKEIRPWIKPSLQLMNETFAGLYGYDALTDREMHELARKFYPVLDPRFVKIALADKTLQAFIVGIPNLNRELRKAKGRIIPFVFYYLTRSLRKSRQFDLLIAGVKPEYRRLGVDVYGMLRIIDAAREAGYATLDSHLEHELNRNVRNVMEKWGGRVVKRYRVYQKELR